ncbi:proton-conducting transporter membrane subunit, partial [Spirochaeta isovalerica]
GSNLAGIKQNKAKRLLGYSSVGQIGLLMIILGLGDMLGDKRDFIALGILVSHYLAKAVLFWIAGMFDSEKLESWAVLRKKPLLFVMFGFALFALTGLPPFPSFFAKWELIMKLGTNGMFVWSALILIASFFEAVYLFRWFGLALKEENEDMEVFKTPLYKWLPAGIFSILLLAAGYYASLSVEAMKGLNYLPLLFILVLALIDWLPVWIKNIISLSGVIWYIYDLYPRIQGDTLRMIFAGVFLIGAVLSLLSGFYYKGKRAGFYPMALAMFLGLITLVEATNLFHFFWGWELMTIGSYFLLIRGKKSAPHGYSYMLFSLGGGYAIMMAFSIAFAASGTLGLSALTNIALYPALAYSLLFLGFMTKTASLPMHIWLPGAHGEADTDVSVMASAILLKAGVFGMVLTLLGMGADASYAKVLLNILVWIGAFTALVGNISSALQENAKRLLAWSSIGQLGMILFGLATMTHLGWLISLAMVVAHFMYKSILFYTIGGVGYRVGSKDMYKMGGLIKRMPLAFIAVLISIIALSGVPPLVGFAAKWLSYNLLVTEGFVVPGTLLIIAGLVAFLYLFRLIHSVFLGQLKDNLRRVKEVNFWFLLPTYIIIGVVMYLSTLPNALLKPIGEWVVKYFPDGALHWEGTRATTAVGYFDGLWIMYVIGGIFATVLVLSLIITSRKKMQKVKQFNIFYSGEHPSRPELVHFAYNFFAHYNRAVGFAVTPVLHRFWDYTARSLHGVSDFIRRIYNGNGQSYAFHLIAYVVLVFLFQGVM